MSVDAIEIPGFVVGAWKIDPVHSDIGFFVRHLMVSKVRGHFTRFEGPIITAVDPLRSEVTATIDMTSIDTANAQRDEHLRSADFFEIDKHPVMTYRSTGIRRDGEDYLMEGELTLKGVTRPVPLRLEVNGFGPDPAAPDPEAGARAGFSASGEIDRMDFGVSFNKAVPGGGVFVSEKVQITLEIEAILQPTI
jgi:polyisoprenoid-binding protein YceI